MTNNIYISKVECVEHVERVAPVAPVDDQADAGHLDRPAYRRVTADVVTLLSLFIGLLFVVPARQVIPTLGGAGRPAILVGAVAAVWWVLDKLRPHPDHDRRREAVRQALYLYATVFAAAYLLGFGRGLPADEARALDRALLTAVSLIGVALLALDGIPTRERLDRLLERVTVGGAFMAAVGIIQFVTGYDLASDIRLPGLALNSDLYGIGVRGGPSFNRISGTATHPIEFGVVLAMLLPFALHYALFATPGRQRQLRWCIAGLIGIAIPFSISRSGTVALLVVMLVLGSVWSRSLRHKAIIGGVVGALALRSAVPGLLGTIRSLFKNFSGDPSVQGRTTDYQIAFGYIADRPWFGRGPRTFLPDRYIILDNQYLDTVITMGYFGLAALILLFLVGIFVAHGVYRSARNDETRHLGQAFMAAFVAAALASFTFDSLSFVTFSGLLFLLFGCVGALVRLERDAPTPPDQTDAGILRRPSVALESRGAS